MADQTSSPIAPAEPTGIATGLDSVRRRLDAIPLDKKGVFVITADWKYGVPVSLKGGFAHRVGDTFVIGGEGKYQKQARSATVYAAWVWVLLVAVLAGPAFAEQSTKDADGFHAVALEKVDTTRWTHVCTTGPVVYRRKMADGDWHITLDNGKGKVVLEIIPAIPLAPPTKGRRIEACGIVRIDRGHRTPQYPAGWPELHPLLSWKPAS